VTCFTPVSGTCSERLSNLLGWRLTAPVWDRLPVTVTDRDQPLGAIGSHTNNDQGAQPCFFEADVEVDPIGEHVDVVALLQGGHEVPRAHPVEVHQGQHISHLRRLPDLPY